MNTTHEDRLPWRFRIEVPGYAPFVSEPIPTDHVGWLDVSLRPADRPGAVRGVVLLADGSPAAHASVALLSSDRSIQLHNSTGFWAAGQEGRPNRKKLCLGAGNNRG